MNAEPVQIDFCRYPPIGMDDWRYGFATARVRVLETLMVPRTTLVDMASAGSFAEAVELISGTEYSISTSTETSEIEQMLLERRREVRKLFVDLMLDDAFEMLLRQRGDFTNIRLAIRRVVMDKPLGLDYNDEGTVPAEEFEEIFEQEHYVRFPEYLQVAIEAAVLGYYENKNIRRIDYEIDRVESAWRIDYAKRVNSEFGLSYARVLVDLNNIRTLLRLKQDGKDDREFFLPDGFVETDRFVHGLDQNFEAIGPLFYATPYYELIEEGVRYLREQQSFLVLERGCEDYLMEFLKTTRSLASGYQPVIAYLLMKEAEIRTLRMVLTGKKNQLKSQLILDRLGNWIG